MTDPITPHAIHRLRTPALRLLPALFGLAVAGCAITSFGHTTEAARVAVVNGLTAAVEFEGESVTRWTLLERMQHYRVPAVSIAIIDDSRLAWSAAFGQRNGQRPASTRTIFQAASLSKPVAAAVALLLVDDGVLDLDAGVNTQLHDWALSAEGELDPDAVTLRGLLSHDAGINIHGFSGYRAGETLPDAEQILDGLPPANSPPVRLIKTPGSGFSYSGGGYQIAQQVMSEATGQRFETLAQHRLLDPLGMDRSFYAADPPLELRADLAIGHAHDGQALTGGWRSYPELAASGLWSTPTDLATFLVAIMDAGRGRTRASLPAEVARLMTHAAVEEMGLGLGVHGTGSARLVDHSGETAGYRTYLVAYPERGQGAVIMTNGNGGDKLIQEILRSLARVYEWPDFAPIPAVAAQLSIAELDARVGDYRVIEYGFTLSLRRKGMLLVAETPRGSSFTFRAVSPRRFIAIEDGAELSFDPAQPDRLQVWGTHAQRIVAASGEPD